MLYLLYFFFLFFVFIFFFSTFFFFSFIPFFFTMIFFSSTSASPFSSVRLMLLFSHYFFGFFVCKTWLCVYVCFGCFYICQGHKLQYIFFSEIVASQIWIVLWTVCKGWYNTIVGCHVSKSSTELVCVYEQNECKEWSILSRRIIAFIA